MKMVSIEDSMVLKVLSGTALTMEDDLSLSGKIENLGEVILEGSIFETSPDASFTNGRVGSLVTGKLSVPDNVAGIVLHPKFSSQIGNVSISSSQILADLLMSRVSVGEDSSLVIAKPDPQLFEANILRVSIQVILT